jgi:hypothetical protein
MKALILALALVTTAQAETIIGPDGMYQVTQSQVGSSTYVTQLSKGLTNSNSGVAMAVPVAVNPATGIGQVFTPQGSYMVQRSANGTTTVVQTSKSK